MTYDELVQYIREEGCRVFVYKNKESIYGGSRGTFSVNEHGPIICAAIKDIPIPKIVEVLLHEYGHYLQHKDGYMDDLDSIVNAYDLRTDWFEGNIELTELELSIVQNQILTMEYNAEKRGVEAGRWLEPEGFDVDFYLKGAASYMAGIKWEFARRSFNPNYIERGRYEAKILTREELYAPLSEEEIEKIDKEFKCSP